MLTESQIQQYLASYPTNFNINVDILVGPTGIGKNWVKNHLKASHDFLIPITSRNPGIDEVHGVDYYFVSKKEYERALKAGELATTLTFRNNYYGYLVDELENINQSNLKPLAIIHFKVLDQFLRKFPKSKIYFMFPPFDRHGLELLKKRMLGRTVEDFEIRWKDTEEQMQAMYVHKPSLLERYAGSKLYIIKDDNSTWQLIKDLNFFP